MTKTCKKTEKKYNIFIICSFFIFFFFIILVLFFIYNYKKFVPSNIAVFPQTHQQKIESLSNLTEKNCVCVFDIDHTINVGNPQPFINLCLEKNCRLAINTARPQKYIKDVPIEKMGFQDPYYSDSDFYWNPKSYSQTSIEIANTKANYMKIIENKYKIPNNCIVLLDDNEYNIKITNNKGYSTIKAEKNNGLLYSDLNKLENILNKCI